MNRAARPRPRASQGPAGEAARTHDYRSTARPHRFPPGNHGQHRTPPPHNQRRCETPSTRLRHILTDPHDRRRRLCVLLLQVRNRGTKTRAQPIHRPIRHMPRHRRRGIRMRTEETTTWPSPSKAQGFNANNNGRPAPPPAQPPTPPHAAHSQGESPDPKTPIPSCPAAHPQRTSLAPHRRGARAFSRKRRFARSRTSGGMPSPALPISNG